MPFNVLVVDDETYARNKMCEMLREIPGYHVCGLASSGDEAVKLASSSNIDVVLMDVRMQGMDGLEAASHIFASDSPPKIILVSAYDQYSIDAFEIGINGYLLKPVHHIKLEKQLNALWPKTNPPLVQEGKTSANKGRSQICYHQGYRDHLVSFSDIIYFKAENKYTLVTHKNGQNFLSESLCKLEEEYGYRTIRIHRNALVNVDYILGMNKRKNGVSCILLKCCNEELRISRRHLSAVRAYLRKFAG